MKLSILTDIGILIEKERKNKNIMKTLKATIRIICSILISCCFVSTINAQIPNSSFEDWEEVIYYDGIGNTITYEKPMFWETNQDFWLERLQKSTESLDGNYSLKLISSIDIAWGPGCSSTVNTVINFPNPIEPNRSLYLYYKAISLDNNGEVFFRVFMNFFQNNNFFDQITWYTFQATTSFTLLEIPLTEGADTISIFLSGGAVNGSGDDCGNISEILVDNLYIGESTLTTLDNIYSEGISIFPNPFGSILFITDNIGSSIQQITLYSTLGKEVLSEKDQFDQLNVASLKSGIYLVKFETERGTITKKIIKE